MNGHVQCLQPASCRAMHVGAPFFTPFLSRTKPDFLPALYTDSYVESCFRSHRILIDIWG